MKKVIILVLLLLFSAPVSVFAQSSYVLPYPSAMPGSNLHKISQIIERIEQYWYFGNFGTFTYTMEKSDKYLVEAKTLFEYRQYLLGYKALEKSNKYFRHIPISLASAQKEGKDIAEKRNLLHQAAQKHHEVLRNLSSEVPAEFIWADEKVQPVPLYLQKLIQESIRIRTECL